MTLVTIVFQFGLSLAELFINEEYTVIGFSDGSVGKESACKAGDMGLIPGLGRSPEKEKATHSNILAWKILWTEEPDGLPSTWSQSQTRLSN